MPTWHGAQLKHRDNFTFYAVKSIKSDTGLRGMDGYAKKYKIQCVPEIYMLSLDIHNIKIYINKTKCNNDV
jgi:hypothetical protein